MTKAARQPRVRRCGMIFGAIPLSPLREGRMQSTLRLASIDCFRGFAVLVMVLATFLFGTEALPAWYPDEFEQRMVSFFRDSLGG